MTGLVVEDVTIRYGSTVALGEFSLSVEPGEVVAVVGPSGSGKSTLLRAVAGLEPLASGRILFDGADLAGVPTHRRGLGLMFQDHALFSHLSVADNVAYGLRMQGIGGDEQRRRVDDLLDLVGLAGFGPRSTAELSGGEGQRVALARALAPQPRLLMLDEPLGSLDRALRAQLTEDLRRLLRELDQTAVHVTHDQAEAFAIADRVVVVADGHLRAEGPPARLWADPGSAFVARFLGHPNVWPVELDADWSVLLASGDGSTAGSPMGRVEPGSPLQGAGRGHHTVLVPLTAVRLTDPPAVAGRPDGSNGAPSMTVEEVRFDEGRFRVGGRVVGTGIVAEAMADVAPRVGDRLAMEIDLDALRPLR